MGNKAVEKFENRSLVAKQNPEVSTAASHKALFNPSYEKRRNATTVKPPRLPSLGCLFNQESNLVAYGNTGGTVESHSSGGTSCKISVE